MMGILLASCGAVVAVNYVALTALPGSVSWVPDPDTGMLRFAGLFSEPNEIGSLMLATVGAGVGYWPIARGWKKVLAGVAMIGAIVLDVMADSRSPFVAIVVCCAAYSVWKYRIRGVLVIVALVAMVHSAAFVLPNTRQYFDRGDVATFTGREVAWDFAIRSIKESPIVGYGFEVEGQILRSQYFPGWDELWSQGYQTSLHNGFLSRAVSLGIPALLFWLFFILRPMICCFLRDQDPWDLRSVVLLAFLPTLILNFTESIPDFRSFAGVLMGLTWTVVECDRLAAKEQMAEQARSADESTPAVVRALRAGPI